VSTTHDLEERRVDLLATLQGEATRFERELDETGSAVAVCCEQSLGRLRDTRWVSLDTVSRLVDELSTAAALERARATSLAADLQATRSDVENVRALGQVAVSAAYEAAVRDRDEDVAQFNRELNAARELARSAAAAEAQVRQELAAVRIRSQEIVDAQMLQLIELKRELDQASAQAERARAQAETVRNDVVTRPAEPPVSVPKVEPGRNEHVPGFAAIEAVLAGSPPLGAGRESWRPPRSPRGVSTGPSL